MDQPKMERLLRLMKMLTANNLYTVDDIAAKLDMSARTIYRYIDTFRNAGFVIKRERDYIRIDKSSPYFKDISQLVHFTDEEAYILKSAIESIDDNNLIKQNLKKKLYTVYDYKILAETVVKGKNAQNVNNLVDAIEQHKQVVLQQYRSTHSNRVANRIVEPFAFTTNYIQVWCYEPQTQANKLFKLARIGSVELLPNDWLFEKMHKSDYMDLFRISSPQRLHVKLILGMRAANLLVEEYPLAERELKPLAKNKSMLDTTVCSYDGIGRFCMGLLDDIEFVDCPEFEKFIQNYLHKFLKK